MKCGYVNLENDNMFFPVFIYFYQIHLEKKHEYK